MAIFEFLNRSTREILDECTVDTLRGSGPGGQKADTTESTVRLSHEPTGLSVRNGQTRSQSKNRQLAVRDLKIQYALDRRHKLRLDSFSVPDSLSGYIENGLRVKESNPHYPFLVKIVLDLLHTTDGRLGEASDALGISTNQFTRFCKDHDRVLEQANGIRRDHGHGAIH